MTPPKEEPLSNQKTKPIFGMAESSTVTASDDIGDLAKSMSALRFVPPRVVPRNSKKS